jgi:hypothetical protein
LRDYYVKSNRRSSGNTSPEFKIASKLKLSSSYYILCFGLGEIDLLEGAPLYIKP